MFENKNILFLLFLLTTFSNYAQRPALDTVKTVGKRLEIITADRLNFLTVDSLHNYTSLAGKALVKQEKTLFYADSIIINTIDNTMEAFGNIHINDADSVHTYSQYLKYLGREKKAFLRKKVKLTDGNGELTSEELEYDVTLKIGTYLTGGKVKNKKTVLTSKEGYYYGDTKDIFFKKKVVLIDPAYKIITDTLQYNSTTEIATFTSPTTISDSAKLVIKTRDGYYDLKNKNGILNKRSFIDDSTYTFTADVMIIDDSTKLSEFTGNAIYKGKDTAQGFDMMANNIKTDRKKDILLATQKPILLIKQGLDSIFITADTLYSARLTDLLKTRNVPMIRDSVKADSLSNKNALPDSSSNKFIEAYFNVKIFSDSLQATGDSLFYSLQDSVFRLFKSPTVWAKENQITGDTIYLYIKNKKPERLYVFENAMAISRVDSTQYYNQVKGRTINALFEDGKINFLKAKGNSENVYYAQDEQKGFIGVNKSSADIIEVKFDESKPTSVTFRRNLDGTTFPMRKTNHEELKLKNFKWLDAVRPKSKYAILTK